MLRLAFGSRLVLGLVLMLRLGQWLGLKFLLGSMLGLGLG